MDKLYFTYKATEDLASIWNYTVDMWSERQADEYYGMLISACRKVADNPMSLGRRYKEIADNLFGFKAGRHIIFYRIVSDYTVEIIRILHECMDLKNRMKEY